jgi:glutamate dehydrogenase (NAD(P)+)
VAIATAELIKRRQGNLPDTTVAVQGYGNVGSAAATILQEMGCTIVAVSDVSGGLYCARGLDTVSLNQHAARHPRHLLEGYEAPGVGPMPNEELLCADVDVLIPAALEHAIHAGNADRVQARTIVEGANGPTTPEADEILNERGIIVVPDILANAGGVIVSYFEWVQDLQNYFWEEEEVNHRLERIMVRSFREVWNFSQERRVRLRLGASMLAVSRVAEAVQARGIFP